jgi:hypothetical protein
MGLHVFGTNYAADQWAEAETAPERLYAGMRSSVEAAGGSIVACWPYADEAMVVVVRAESAAEIGEVLFADEVDHIGVLDDLSPADVRSDLDALLEGATPPLDVAPRSMPRCKECQRKPPPHAAGCKWAM